MAGYPACKFINPGDAHWGTITGIRDVQASDFKTKQPLTYPDGNPVLQTVLTIEKSDGELHRIFVRAGAMRNACATALGAAGADDVEVGGMIKVMFLHMEPATNGGERKAFRAWYKKPDPGLPQPQTATQTAPADDDIPDTAYADDEPPF